MCRGADNRLEVLHARLAGAGVAFDRTMDDDTDQWNQTAYFWIGLFGIVATGAVIGIGGDNYWGLARLGSMDASLVPSRALALLGVVVFVVGLSDLVAFGVIFAGAVVVVQRLRGVYPPS